MDGSKKCHNKTHKLVYGTYSLKRICDECEKLLESNEESYSCRICNFDLCVICYFTEEKEENHRKRWNRTKEPIAINVSYELESYMKQNLFIKLKAFITQQQQQQQHGNTIKLCKNELIQVKQMDSFSCGYRSLQMVLSSLLKNDCFKDKIFLGISKLPSVFTLQQFLLNAWYAGFDEEGANQLQWEEILNSKIRIGACEVCAVLRSQNIPSKLIDFKSNKPNTNENVITNYFSSSSSSSSSFHRSCEEEIGEVVWDYFSKNENSFPIYFQEVNHAITIVGCYKDESNNIKLIVFDSVHKINDEETFCRNWKRNLTYRFDKKQKEFQMIVLYEKCKNKQEEETLLAREYGNVLYDKAKKEEKDDNDVIEYIVID